MSINMNVKFEEAIQELEKIVAELEGGNIPLERSVELYNRGVELHKCCNDIIKDINLHIESVNTGDAAHIPQDE